MRFCIECNDKKCAINVIIKSMKTRNFEANLNELKRHPPNEFGHMLSFFKLKDDFDCNKLSK